MGWFEEQIRTRIQSDEEAFSDALAGMAGAVMGQRIVRALEDDRIRTKNAIDEILKYYHVKPAELPDNIKDLDAQLEYLMRPASIMRRTVYLDGPWYTDAIGAMLGMRRDNGSIVALLPGHASGYQFYDAPSGKWVKLNKQTAGLIDREAICFYKPLPLRKLSVKDLLVFMFQSIAPRDVVMVAAASLAASLVGLLLPAIQKIIYSSVVTSTSLPLLFAVFSFLLGVSLSQALIHVINSLLIQRLSVKVRVQVSAAAMMRVLSLPASFFKGYSAGDLATRMNYVSALCTALLQAIFSAGFSSVFSLVYVAQMGAYGAALVVPAMAVVLFTAVFTIVTVLIQMNITQKQMTYAAQEAGMDYALLSGVQKIKLSGAEKRAFARWARLYAKSAKLQYDPPAILKFSPVVTTCASLIGTIVLYYFAITSSMRLGDYFAFQSAYGMVMGAFTALTGTVATLAQIKPILEMIRPILDAEPELSGSQRMVTRLSGGVELNNISFRYTETMPMVIDNLSLKIRPGQYVAIVGKTGCGKSTLVRLMLGFEKPQKGAIYFDGQDISGLDLKSLRRSIGTVMQDGKLFQGDIFSNISITCPQLTQQGAWEAAEMAGIAEDIRRMPMGMHTFITEGGGGISGGQRQRLLIARAIAGKPRLLIFDEATSALDNVTQKVVSDSLNALKCTRIVIAHRLSTIRGCDRIIVLDEGRIIEDGTYEALIAQNGVFAELVERQRLDV